MSLLNIFDSYILGIPFGVWLVAIAVFVLANYYEYKAAKEYERQFNKWIPIGLAGIFAIAVIIMRLIAV